MLVKVDGLKEPRLELAQCINRIADIQNVVLSENDRKKDWMSGGLCALKMIAICYDLELIQWEREEKINA